MITDLKLTNFRSHADTTLKLTPMTLMVGPAGGGKSNIFKALTLVQNSVHRSLIELFPPGLGEFQWVRSRWARETDPIELEIGVDNLEGFPNQHAIYTLKIADSPAGLYVLEETLQSKAGDQDWEWVFQRRRNSRQLREFGRVDPYDGTILRKVRHPHSDVDPKASRVEFARAVATALSRFGYYHLEASQLKSLGTGQAWDRIGYYGERVPDFLAWAKSTPQGVPVFDAILDEMRQLLPHLDVIIVTQVSAEKQGIAMSFKGQEGYIAAPDLSDGTLFTLGLLCVVHSPQKPHLLCIEEPETGLHPRRLRWLFERLISLAYPGDGERPVQVMLTTHSPYLVDLFSDMQDSVQIVEQSDGKTRVALLTDIQKKLHNEDMGDAIGHEWATGLFEGL